jgi:hypothetical protein
MKPQVSIHYSFLCGLCVFIISSILGSFDSTQPFWFAFVFTTPGVAYALITVKSDDKAIFAIMSGILNLAVTFVSCMLYGFTVLTAGPAMVFYFLLYRSIVDSNLNLRKGVLYSLLFGTLSGLPPLAAFYNNSGEFDFIIISTLYPLWQTLFAVALKLSAKPNTQNIIQSSSVTTA